MKKLILALIFALAGLVASPSDACPNCPHAKECAKKRADCPCAKGGECDCTKKREDCP